MSEEQDKQDIDEQGEDHHAASVDALAAMANGIHDSGSDDQSPPPFDAPDDEEIAEALAEFPVPDAIEVAVPEVQVDPQTVAQRQARAANIARKAKHAHAAQFKQTMIPLLIAAAALLLILGTWVLLKLPTAEQRATNPDTGNMLYRPWALYAVLAAYPLAAILLLGAWLFRRDVQKPES